MRVAVFHNLPSGGAKRAVYEWVRRLAVSSDIEIDVYTLSSAAHDFCDIRPFAHHHTVYPVAVRRLFNSPWGRLNQIQRWRDLGAFTHIGRRIATDINARGYDVLFAHPCQYTVIPPVLMYTDVPSVYYLHEPFGHTFVRHIQRPYIKQNSRRTVLDQVDPLIRLYYHRLQTIQRKSIDHTTRLLANSKFTQEEMKKSFAVDAPISQYGVDLDHFRPLADVGKEDFILSVGEMSPRKGFDFIVESLALIPEERRPQLRLACNRVDPDEFIYIRQLADQKNVELLVLINLNTDELRVQYNMARFCVYAPILEPFGLVPLEAMACGTAVVGIREGGVQESVVHEHTGILVERDSSQFALAVQRLLNDPALTEQYGRNGREHVSHHWTWERSTATVEENLRACSRDSSGGGITV